MAVAPFRFGRYAGPFVALGGLVAVACLASTWYIHRLQSDLAQAVRQDSVALVAAIELQVHLRHLRVHSLVYAAHPTPERLIEVHSDLGNVEASLAEVRHSVASRDEPQLVARIERDYLEYRKHLDLDRIPPRTGTLADLAAWSDEHHMADLLEPCRELADRQHARMTASLARNESQTTWAGRLLLGFGLFGVLGGLLSGYASARGRSQREALLSVRVHAVQAELDQDVGAMMVGPQPPGELEAQLDRVVERVKEVCQKLQEQERELLRAEQMAAVGHLAAGVAHEVRNPLTGIKFLIEAALRPPHPTPLTEEDLRLIQQEIIRMERTVQELLDYARASPPDRRPQDLRDVVREAVRAARSRAGLKSVSLAVDLPNEAVPALADRDQFLSLLTNLLFNAIDASPPGQRVECRVRPAENDMLTVEVADCGPGIDPAIADRLFTPFATTKPTGTGLGLSVARRVVREHGGSISAANRPTGGACFTVRFPAAEPVHVENPGRG